MNAIEHSIFTLLHYAILLRDTLEYCTNKPADKYSVEMYNQRKQVLTGMLDNPSQLSEFLKNNGETGKKIEGQLREFIDEIYGPESTILRVGAEGLRVDQTQHLKIYNYVIGLHETLLDVIKGYIKYAKDNKHMEENTLLEKAFVTNNKFYRGLAYMLLIEDLNKLFKEFNDAMKETQGKPSPQSNFITNDIQQTVSFMAFVRQHSGFDRGQPDEDRELLALFDKTEETIKKMNGTTKLEEGENLFEETKQNYEFANAYVAIKEKENMQILQDLFKEANEFEIAAREAAANKDKEQK